MESNLPQRFTLRAVGNSQFPQDEVHTSCGISVNQNHSESCTALLLGKKECLESVYSAEGNAIGGFTDRTCFHAC